METKINFGWETANIDHKTGIRYGVISMHDVTQAWAETAEPDYGECSDEAIEHGFMDEPLGWYVDDDEYKAIDCLDSDIMVIR